MFHKTGGGWINGPIELDFRLPFSLEQINENSFSEIDKETLYIVIPDSIKTIGIRAFYGSTFREKIVEIPEGVTNIGDEAFYTETIEELIIPDSATVIGKDVCDRRKTLLNVNQGSYAALYASENGYKIVTAESEDTSWLND